MAKVFTCNFQRNTFEDAGFTLAVFVAVRELFAFHWGISPLTMALAVEQALTVIA